MTMIPDYNYYYMILIRPDIIIPLPKTPDYDYYYDLCTPL